MKTEKEFSNFFVEAAAQPYSLSIENEQALNDLSGNYWIDLTSHLSSYFSYEDRLQITQKAAVLLNEQLRSETFNEAWKNVLRDFNQKQQWGFQTTSIKPKKVQNEEEKIFWKLFKYVWAFFQSMVILKIAVYYFGLESASNPDQTSKIWVWLFFSLSASSLIFFAYRNRHDKN